MLRDYQDLSIDQIRAEFAKGNKKVLLHLATGAGKTVIFCEIIKQASRKGKRCAIVTRGRKLVDQASQRLFREDVQHGVLMSQHWNENHGAPNQVCSVDTLISRNIALDSFDMLIVDEAHLFTKETAAGDLIRDFNGFVVAVTATPYVSDGLDHLADAIVHPITMQELIDKNYLVPFRYFAPSEPDLRAIKTVRGDYKNDQLEGAMTKGKLTGDIIQHWSNIAEGRPTLCFAVNIHHSKILVEKFNEAGISAEHCDAESTDAERAAAIKRLESGKTKVICNVGIFCTGVDVPVISAIILARPTKSLNLFIQQCGRGTRTFRGKSNCILLDHSGNIRRHGFPTMEPEVNLDGIPKGKGVSSEYKTCKKCFAVYEGKECPLCGAPEPRERAVIEEEPGELSEIKVSTKNPIEQWLEYLEQQRRRNGRNGRKQAWVYFKLLEKFSIDECRSYLPSWFIKIKEGEKSDNPFSGSPFQGKL